MRVYLSSTLLDLLPERQAVRDALGGECVVVESYTADERDVRTSCLADVAGCNLYVAIIGMRYGFIPPGHCCSITQLEYREARANKIPTLVFVKEEDKTLPSFHDAVTNQNPRELIESFRKSVTDGADGAPRARVFQTAADLKAHLLQAYLALVQRQHEAHPHQLPTRPPLAGNPYPGLRAFRTHEADRFFGRDDEVADLVDRLLARGQHFVALIGASGSGKSSLVYAGLIPALLRDPSSARWSTIAMMPRELGDDPFLALAAALKSQFPDCRSRPAELAKDLREAPASIAARTAQALGDSGPNPQLLLFVDQFEEIFSQKVDADVRTAFFALLAAAAACPLLRVVISMRSDFYALWPQDEVSMKLLRHGHFPVAVPGLAALARMVEGPARAAQLRFQPPGLVQRILDDTGIAPGALALVEFALSQLYERRDGDALNEAAYVRIGGVAGAIEDLAERAVRQAELAITRAGGVLNDEAWSRLFAAIASVEERGTGLAVVRRRATVGELPRAAITLAQHLIEQRLLGGSGGGGAVIAEQPAVYEVGHEAVFSHWKRFRDWFKDQGQHLAMRQQAERAAADWHKASRPKLLRWDWERQKSALKSL